MESTSVNIVKDFFLFNFKGTKPKSVLCCVSGGADSIALLYILNELTSQFGWKVGIAHFNHKLRGEESEGDAGFVVETGDKLNLPVFMKDWEKDWERDSKKENLEDSARRARYEWFREIAESEGYELISTGHNLGDQAETVLHNIFRGSGIRGLAGIKNKSSLSGKVILVRPMLKISRNEILEYLHERNINYRVDSTNLDTKFSRNMIRHEVLPLLTEKLGSHVTESLSRLAENADNENEFLNELTDSYKKLVILESNEKSKVLKYDVLMDIGPVLRRRMILSCYTDLTGGNIIGKRTSGISHSIMHDLLQLMESDNTTWEYDLGGGISASRSYDKIILSSEKVIELELIKYSVSIPGETFLDKFGGTFLAEIVEKETEKDSFVEYFDLDKISLPLEIRNRREGDKIELLKIKGKKKLKEWFIDMKIPKHARSHIPLLWDKNNLLWIIGYRKSSNAEIDNNTKRILKVTFKNIGHELNR